MLKISKLADYGTVILVHLVNHQGLTNAREIAKATKISHPTVIKLLKIMMQANYLRSAQGYHGGYQLKVLPENISLVDIINVVDGGIQLTECTKEGHKCAIASICRVKDKWQIINNVVTKALGQISLQDLLDENEASIGKLN